MWLLIISIDKIAGCIVGPSNLWLWLKHSRMYLGPISHLPASSTSSPSPRSRNRRNTSAMPEVPPPPSAIKSLYRKAQSHIPAAALSAPSWLRSYEDFVMKNATQVTQIESALRSISYIIPGMCVFRTFFTDFRG